jgi:hypothetical protein
MLTTMLPSHASAAATGVTLLRHDVYAKSCWQQCYRVILAMTLPGQLDRSVM